ncbi:MAG: UDP-N-acetylmuramoyl-L-alanine--D-glutamate ligase [Acidaminobacteraceae bacterium]
MFKDKKIIVVGIARSGISTLKALKEVSAYVIINDMKTKENLAEILPQIDGLYNEAILGEHPDDYSGVDIMVLSPGVPTDLEFINKARKSGVEVIGELELAYRLSNSKKFIGITGTNGKTTTTALVGKMFEDFGSPSYVVGNIGIPAVSVALTNKKQDFMITEVSSFQLETISKFKTDVSAVLNLTPDHLNRHKTMENYIDAKARIFENQIEGDILILNYDNELTRKLKFRTDKSRVVFFSRNIELEDGAYVSESKLMIKDKLSGLTHEVIDVNDIFIPGPHNLENAMAASLIAFYSGISIESIKSSLMSFKGVEHRLEYVDLINEIKYYNDSKGTNPDSSIVAVKSMNGPTVLIAGGMDKASEFDGLIDSFGDTVVELVLFGETKFIIEKCAHRKGFKHTHIVNSLEEAIKKASTVNYKTKNILLSPACASWDMYENYEKRGEEFKKLVNSLRG